MAGNGDKEKEEVLDFSHKILLLREEIGKVVIGQENLIRDILIALFGKGHILLEGVPGLAKTLAVSSMSQVLNLSYQRIQFTPDLLPSDLIGARVFNPIKNDFYVKKGPIFSNFILADEINRAPSKVQSALLEAMAERQVSIGDETFFLEEPFIVLATQNPIEQDGTYNLPEAQLDRFLLKTIVDYPNEEEEISIMKENISGNIYQKLTHILSKEDIKKIQELISKIFVSDSLYEYIKDISFYTRKKDIPLAKYIQFGVSPRASISLLKASLVNAFLEGRDFILPEDIKEMAKPVLRHRIILSYEAIADNIKSDDIVEMILKNIKIK
ncbi:MoxR family ATPase [Candidatus Gracilibacteria bacterium]|nr:MoxR family ATPase [Candidatus Gracilibacteria bacterium]NUJ99102.1 MoxR family ATPase [Candidatus Gracilibacteria bacterium]